MVPQSMVSGQFGSWFRKILFDIEATMRLGKKNESFYVLAMPRTTITNLQVLPNQVVTNGLDDDLVITQILVSTPSEFTFNFLIGGSQQYYFSSEVSAFQFLLTIQPYQLVRPIVLKAGGQITANFTDVANATYAFQLAFAGYRVKQGTLSN